MSDIVDSRTRSRMMAGIKGRDTKPEKVLRKALHARGFRYRLHAKSVPGQPDLLLPKHRAAVFVHGCFWHRHTGCRYTTTPATRPDFWQAKFDANVQRDVTVGAALREQGWRVGIVWACALRTPERVESAADLVAGWLRGDAPDCEIDEARASGPSGRTS